MSIFGNLDGKTAVVCGASQGLGAATAQALASLGARIIAVARSESGLNDLLRLLPTGPAHCAIAADLADKAAVAKLVADLERMDPAHILVNNTGGPAPASCLAATCEDMMGAIQMHLLANMALSQAMIPGMRKSGYGRIINIVSVSARSPVANLAVSNSVRGAVLNWAKTLSREVAPQGITVNSVLPGYTRTTRLDNIISVSVAREGVTLDAVEQRLLAEIPAARFGTPAELAAAVAYFALPAAAYTTGTTLAVDGGWLRAT